MRQSIKGQASHRPEGAIVARSAHRQRGRRRFSCVGKLLERGYV